MGDKTKIEWTDASWTPIRARNLKTGKVGWHCEHATTGCEFCYAETLNKRLGTGLPFKPGHRADVEIFLDERMLRAPLKWKRPRMIFVCSMTDPFADFVTDAMLFEMFAVMGACEWQGLGHQFQILTKRADRMQQWVSTYGHRAWNSCRLGTEAWPARNIWLGVSTERQKEADERIPLLLQTPAAVRFISAEPLLGVINLRGIRQYNPTGEPWIDALRGTVTYGDYLARGPHECSFNVRTQCSPAELPKLDWVIVGGESGHDARPMHPDWARGLRDQCAAAGVPYFFKQWGEYLPWSQFDSVRKLEDHPEQTRFRTMEFNDGRWKDVGSPMWYDIVDGNVDDEHCVGRVGKSKAGRLLDNTTHDAMPRQQESVISKPVRRAAGE